MMTTREGSWNQPLIMDGHFYVAGEATDAGNGMPRHPIFQYRKI
jgi:hypothetical protein